VSVLIPKRVFFTKGVGVHKDKLGSFEDALRKAGIERCNLVAVSSILPPGCKIISAKKGLKELSAGALTFCVYARCETNEAGRLVAAAVGLARPASKKKYGYLSEYHDYGVKQEIASEYAEDLAATMLATTLGVEFDPAHAWKEREEVYKASGHIIQTSNVCQTAKGEKTGLWTTVLAAAVFLLD